MECPKNRKRIQHRKHLKRNKTDDEGDETIAIFKFKKKEELQAEDKPLSRPINPAGRKRMFENDRQYQLRTAEEVAYRNSLDQARMQQRQRQLQQAQQRGQLRAKARYGDKKAKQKLEKLQPKPLLSPTPQKKGSKAKPIKLYSSKDMVTTKNLNTPPKKPSTPPPKKYVIQNGVAYPIAKPKPKKKKTKEGDFNWKDFGMPSWKDLMK